MHLTKGSFKVIATRQVWGYILSFNCLHFFFLNRKLDWCGEKKAIVSVRDDYDRNACWKFCNRKNRYCVLIVSVHLSPYFLFWQKFVWENFYLYTLRQCLSHAYLWQELRSFATCDMTYLYALMPSQKLEKLQCQRKLKWAIWNGKKLPIAYVKINIWNVRK